MSGRFNCRTKRLIILDTSVPDEEIPDCQRTKEEEMYRLFRSLRELELFGLAVSYICLFRYVKYLLLGWAVLLLFLWKRTFSNVYLLKTL